ncbi:hypothetical protein [Halalkalicoccus salilacus]|uniref:hypothetical protein n=1 Tax=Halalkalicoccus salilacus TaxID=3117459 RepID=UPI00300F1245
MYLLTHTDRKDIKNPTVQGFGDFTQQDSFAGDGSRRRYYRGRPGSGVVLCPEPFTIEEVCESFPEYTTGVRPWEFGGEVDVNRTDRRRVELRDLVFRDDLPRVGFVGVRRRALVEKGGRPESERSVDDVGMASNSFDTGGTPHCVIGGHIEDCVCGPRDVREI